MHRPSPARLALPALALLLAACHVSVDVGSRAKPDAAAAQHADAWWRAFTVSDTAFLERHTADMLTFVVNSGRVYDRAAMFAELPAHVLGSKVLSEMRGPATVHTLAGGTTVVAMRVHEGMPGAAEANLRYLTVIERTGAGADDWRVVAAQSTRESELTPRVAIETAGPLADYVGSYQGQRGGTLRVVARDGALLLTDPTGAETRMEPVGLATFERTEISPGAGVVRFVFLRDASGAVVAMERLAAGAVNVWPRQR